MTIGQYLTVYSSTSSAWPRWRLCLTYNWTNHRCFVLLGLVLHPNHNVYIFFYNFEVLVKIIPNAWLVLMFFFLLKYLILKYLRVCIGKQWTCACVNAWIVYKWRQRLRLSKKVNSNSKYKNDSYLYYIILMIKNQHRSIIRWNKCMIQNQNKM